jgi:dihydrolipoamide dehydrogenase
MIPGMEADGKQIVTYLEAILQDHLPASIVIIGAGAIGMEFATVWSSYGVDVTVVEMLPHILPLEDEEVAVELTKQFNKRGVKTLTNAKVLGIEKTGNGVNVKVGTAEGEKILQADQALMSIGFKPNSAGLGLEDVGVKVSPRGFIEIDDRMATNVPGIWAIGDVTGKLMLAHVASAMGIVCAENIAGAETITLDYTMMPRATYSQPQVASFGLTEAQAKEKGYEVKVGRFPFQPNGKALGLNDYAGFIKIVTDVKSGEIYGASMIGPDVSELLPELTLAQHNELTVEEIARNVHAHPTLSEVVMEAAENAEGRSIHI